jgi:hypothetical protein
LALASFVAGPWLVDRVEPQPQRSLTAACTPGTANFRRSAARGIHVAPQEPETDLRILFYKSMA